MSDPANKPPSRQKSIDLRIAPGESLHLDARVSAQDIHLSAPARTFSLRRWLSQPAVLLFAIAFAAAGLVFGIGLERYPAHFTAQEAASSVAAQNLVQRGLEGEGGQFLPTFFQTDFPYSLGTSVYVQVLAQFGFQTSVTAVRGMNALLNLAALGCLAFALRRTWKDAGSWILLLIAAGLPGWFFLARTGLEAAQALAFYTASLGGYLFYRSGKTNWLYPAVCLGMLAFYAMPSAQLAVLLTGFLLAIFDLRYHLSHKRAALTALVLGLLFLLPLLRWLVEVPDLYVRQLQAIGPPWSDPLTPGKGFSQWVSGYLSSFTPTFWFLPHPRQPVRYTPGDYPLVHWVWIPLILVGLRRVFTGWREPLHRLTLAVFLSAPVGAAFFPARLPERALMLAGWLLLAGLGLAELIRWVKINLRLPARWADGAAAAALGLGSFVLLETALVSGPGWITNYGIEGLQYGAQPVYAAAKKFAVENPQMKVWISPNWTSRSDVLQQFFARGQSNIQSGTPEAYTYEIKEDLTSQVFLLTAEETRKVLETGKFDLHVEKNIPYPNGAPGFMLVSLAYKPNIQAILDQEAQKRRILVPQNLMLDGQSVQVRYSSLDMGGIEAAFDGDLNSVLRTAEANPLVIEIDFPSPQPMSSLSVRVGAEPVELQVTINVQGERTSRTYAVVGNPVEGYKELAVDFGAALPVNTLRLSLLDVGVPEPAHVHLWEIQWAAE